MDIFSLLPEEHATLGVTHRGDTLKLRPTAHVFAYAGMLAVFGCVLPVIGLSLNGPALILVLLGAVLLVRAVLTAAAVVVADAEHVTIRNRASRKRIPIEHISSVATDHRHFPFGKAPYWNFWAGPKYLVVGYVTELSGRHVYCDAATSPPAGQTMLDRAGLGALAPSSGGPTSAEVQMAALKRWVTAHQIRPGPSATTVVQS